MHLIKIDVSPHQLRRLKKGHKIRLRKGTGFNLIVHPNTYHLMSRAFNRDKGVQVKLSEEELVANQTASNEPAKMEEHANETAEQTGEMPSIEGKGIFSKIKSGLKAMSPILKPLAKAGLSHYAPKVSEKLSNKPALQKAFNYGAEQAGKKLSGTGMRGRAVRERSESPEVHGLTRKLGHAVANSNGVTASISKQAIDRRIKNQYPTYEELKEEPFAPFSRGYGFHANQHAIVGRGGGMLGHGVHSAPALMSQPYSANYQMAHFLPPHFQHYNNSIHGNGLGAGMYAGNGLYAGRGYGLFM